MQKLNQNKPSLNDVKFIKMTILFPEHSSATEKVVLDNIDDIIYGLTQSDKQSKKFFSNHPILVLSVIFPIPTLFNKAR